ncbi:hypothetical protein LAZ67_20002012 [Cordylochernes scorpioides]|uniref:Uncharacterized protein n=1 Tax=Cordylochernes scorpioides TaxID=51811 RepID=A0ABY6LKN0_9ARAC|nr:hypothetical protein LAZ67_20002012 [Cordylochernes scorpioides]
MKIHPDGTRTYRTCNNCPGVELTPTHIFSCPAMAAALQKIDMDPEQQLYTPKIVDIAAAVVWDSLDLGFLRSGIPWVWNSLDLGCLRSQIPWVWDSFGLGFLGSGIP